MPGSKTIKIYDYINLTRLNKPIGIYLLLLPCLWTLAIDKNIFNTEIVSIFIIGSIITRSMGCVINDLIDSDIDKLVSRTKDRPIASGSLKKSESKILILFLSVIGLLLVLRLNRISLYIAFIASIFTIIYPFTKRIIKLPQLFLGITFNLGIIMADSINNDRIAINGMLLYISAIFWTIAYDTIYANQDKIYDKKIGLNSSAITFGKYQKTAINICYLLMMIFLLLAGYINSLSYVFYTITIISILYFILKTYKLDLDDVDESSKLFKDNAILGLIILIVMIVEIYL